MRNALRFCGVCVALLALAAPARAMEAKPMVKIGFDFGGEKLVTVTYTDGSTQTVRANDGLFLGGGVSIRDEQGALETEVSLSYKVGGVTAKNGNVDWTRLPLDVLVFYRQDKLRAGAGITYHLSPKLKGDGDASFIDVGFENALGFLLQADYLLTDKMALGLRVASIEYKPKGGLENVKSNGLGIGFSVAF